MRARRQGPTLRCPSCASREAERPPRHRPPAILPARLRPSSSDRPAHSRYSSPAVTTCLARDRTASTTSGWLAGTTASGTFRTDVAFFGEHAREVAQTLEMLFSNGCQHCDVRFNDTAESGDLAASARSNFDYCDIRGVRRREQRKRDAHLIVVIGRRRVDLQHAPQRGAQQFLGGRLSIGARDRNYQFAGAAPNPPTITGECAQCRKGVPDGEDRNTKLTCGSDIRNDDGACPSISCVAQKTVRIRNARP